MNCYNFVADSFHTQRNFVADFLQAKCDFTPKTAVLRFWAPFGGLGQRTTITELFSLGVTAEAQRANIGSKSASLLQRGRLTHNFR